MKRIILIMMTLTTACLCFGAPKGNAAEPGLGEVIGTMRQNKEADVVTLGWLGMSFFKVALKCDADDEEDKAVLELMKGTKKMTVADFSDCSRADRTAFSHGISNALHNYEVILEIRDDDDTVTFYGIFDEKDGTVNDIVMYSPSECALICFDGKYKASAIGNILGNGN